jgi:hypothetical protein
MAVLTIKQKRALTLGSFDFTFYQSYLTAVISSIPLDKEDSFRN